MLDPPPFRNDPNNHLDRYRRTTGILAPGNRILREGLEREIGGLVDVVEANNK